MVHDATLSKFIMFVNGFFGENAFFLGRRRIIHLEYTFTAFLVRGLAPIRCAIPLVWRKNRLGAGDILSFGE